jgi:hypothetical protein
MTKIPAEDPSQFSLPENRVEYVSSILWILFGSFVVFQAQRLPYTDEFGPSAGFFPFWLGTISIFLGVIMAIQTGIRRAQKQVITFASKSAVFKMISIVACLAVLPWLIEAAGFFLTSGVLFFFLLYIVEKESLTFSLISAVLSFFLLWLIFGVILKLSLPLGFLQFMRF